MIISPLSRRLQGDSSRGLVVVLCLVETRTPLNTWERKICAVSPLGNELLPYTREG